MLADAVEDDRPRGHVDAHRERLRCEEQLDPTLLEEHLDDLLQDGQNPGMVDADAALQQLRQVKNLRQLPIGALNNKMPN